MGIFHNSMFLLFGNLIKISKIIRFILCDSTLRISNARLCDVRQSDTNLRTFNARLCDARQSDTLNMHDSVMHNSETL